MIQGHDEVEAQPLPTWIKRPLAKVRSLSDLRQRARADERYARLAVLASHNLGGPSGSDLRAALHWLELNAMETDEGGVVDEINGVQDLL